jgi:signal transduction histidine kinase
VNTPQPSEPEEAAASPARSHEDLSAWTEQLAVRSQELDRFGRVAAHDLRAPLRSIEAFTRLALETEDPVESSEHLERVLNAVGRMRRLLDSLVDFADAVDAPLDVTPASLDEVVRSAIADLSVDVDESGAIIDVGPLPNVECDPTQLRRVFTNVLSNSIRYTGGHPPHIAVRGFEEPDQVRVTVTDDGDGFSADLTEVAFEPLRRLTSNGAGQGIGLSICRRIIERHGGEIWAKSAPGAGTTISLILPREAGR